MKPDLEVLGERILPSSMKNEVFPPFTNQEVLAFVVALSMSQVPSTTGTTTGTTIQSSTLALDLALLSFFEQSSQPTGHFHAHVNPYQV